MATVSVRSPKDRLSPPLTSHASTSPPAPDSLRHGDLGADRRRRGPRLVSSLTGVVLNLRTPRNQRATTGSTLKACRSHQSEPSTLTSTTHSDDDGSTTTAGRPVPTGRSPTTTSAPRRGNTNYTHGPTQGVTLPAPSCPRLGDRAWPPRPRIQRDSRWAPIGAGAGTRLVTVKPRPTGALPRPIRSSCCC